MKKMTDTSSVNCGQNCGHCAAESTHIVFGEVGPIRTIPRFWEITRICGHISRTYVPEEPDSHRSLFWQQVKRHVEWPRVGLYLRPQIRLPLQKPVVRQSDPAGLFPAYDQELYGDY
jgi:hypothetical protein